MKSPRTEPAGIEVPTGNHSPRVLDTFDPSPPLGLIAAHSCRHLGRGKSSGEGLLVQLPLLL